MCVTIRERLDIKEENEYIFTMLKSLIKDFDRCYVCDKELDEKTMRFIKLPTHTLPICLCKKCFKKFLAQRRLHERLFLDETDRDKIINNEIGVVAFVNEQLIKVSFAHKMWLDKQRQIRNPRCIGGKNKNK